MRKEVYEWAHYCCTLLLLSDFALRSHSPIIYAAFAALIVTYMVKETKRR